MSTTNPDGGWVDGSCYCKELAQDGRRCPHHPPGTFGGAPPVGETGSERDEEPCDDYHGPRNALGSCGTCGFSLWAHYLKVRRTPSAPVAPAGRQDTAATDEERSALDWLKNGDEFDNEKARVIQAMLRTKGGTAAGPNTNLGQNGMKLESAAGPTPAPHGMTRAVAPPPSEAFLHGKIALWASMHRGLPYMMHDDNEFATKVLDLVRGSVAPAAEPSDDATEEEWEQLADAAERELARHPPRTSQPVAVAPEPSRNYDEVTCVWSVTKNKSFRCILDAGHNGLHHVVFGDAEHLGEPGVAETAERERVISQLHEACFLAGDSEFAITIALAINDACAALAAPAPAPKMETLDTVLHSLHERPAPAQPEFRPADEFFEELRAAQPEPEWEASQEYATKSARRAMDKRRAAQLPAALFAPFLEMPNTPDGMKWAEYWKARALRAEAALSLRRGALAGEAAEHVKRLNQLLDPLHIMDADAIRRAIAWIEAHPTVRDSRFCHHVGCTIVGPHEHNSGGPKRAGPAQEDTP